MTDFYFMFNEFHFFPLNVYSKQKQLSTSRLFSSCPSLPDLTTAVSNGMWPTQQTIGLNNDRRKSWTAIEDLTIECNKGSHKRSVKISVLFDKYIIYGMFT